MAVRTFAGLHANVNTLVLHQLNTMLLHTGAQLTLLEPTVETGPSPVSLFMQA